MRTLHSLKQSDELNKYLDSDIQSDSSRSPGPRLIQEENAQKAGLQQVITGVRREVQIPKQDDDADEQAAEEPAAGAGETQDAKEPMSLLEVEQRAQEEDGAPAEKLFAHVMNRFKGEVIEYTSGGDEQTSDDFAAGISDDNKDSD